MPYRLATAQYNQYFMGRPLGFEPTNTGATIRSVNRFATIAIIYNIGRHSRTRTHIDSFGHRCSVNWTIPLDNKWWRGADSICRTRWERIYSPPRLATSLPLQYKLFLELFHEWWLGTESNRRHKDFQSFALPTELPSHTLY